MNSDITMFILKPVVVRPSLIGKPCYLVSYCNGNIYFRDYDGVSHQFEVDSGLVYLVSSTLPALSPEEHLINPRTGEQLVNNHINCDIYTVKNRIFYEVVKYVLDERADADKLVKGLKVLDYSLSSRLTKVVKNYLGGWTMCFGSFEMSLNEWLWQAAVDE